jgi:DNA repair protein RadC
MKNEPIVSESFSNGRRHFFLDFSLASNHSNYIRMTRNDEQADGSYKRSSVVFFEEDFVPLIEGFASLLHHARYAPQPRPLKKSGGIKSWPEMMRPRERMLAQGRGAMEDAELLAMLIGSGTAENSAVGLCCRILASVDWDLRRLARLSLEELCRFRGIGMARGLSIIAAAELSVRMLNASRSFALEGKNQEALG